MFAARFPVTLLIPDVRSRSSESPRVETSTASSALSEALTPTE